MDLANVFLTPQNATHRQYEALRAYFVEQLPGPEVAKRFGYTLGSFHQLVHQFRQNPDRQFFAPPLRPGVKAGRSRASANPPAAQTESVHLRYQRGPEEGRHTASRRGGGRRPARRKASPSCRDGRTRSGHRESAHASRSGRCADAVPGTTHHPHQVRRSCFSSCRHWLEMSFDRVIGKCHLPGTKMIPAAHALRSLLALETFRQPAAWARDERGARRGTRLVCRIERRSPSVPFLRNTAAASHPACYPKLMRHWFDAMSGLGLEHGSFVRSGLPHHSVPRRRRAAGEALRFQEKPPPEGNSGVFGPGRRPTVLLLRQHATCGKNNKTTRFCSSSSSGSSGPGSFPKN